MLQHNKVVIAKWKYNNAMMLKLWEQNENSLWEQNETWEHLVRAMLERIVKEKRGVGTTLKTIERRSMQNKKTQKHCNFIVNKKIMNRSK